MGSSFIHLIHTNFKSLKKKICDLANQCTEKKKKPWKYVAYKMIFSKSIISRGDKDK